MSRTASFAPGRPSSPTIYRRGTTDAARRTRETDPKLRAWAGLGAGLLRPDVQSGAMKVCGAARRTYPNADKGGVQRGPAVQLIPPGSAVVGVVLSLPDLDEERLESAERGAQCSERRIGQTLSASMHPPPH